MHRIVLLTLSALLLVGCQSNDDSGSGDVAGGPGSIGEKDNNRYELEAIGGISFRHTGGLICRVEDGELLMGFSIDTSDDDVGMRFSDDVSDGEYTAAFPGFEPSATELNGTFTLTRPGIDGAEGDVKITFAIGSAPDDFPGVVRAAGSISGPIRGASGGAELFGSYACFLQDSGVRN